MDIKDHPCQIERIPRTPHITLAEDEPLEATLRLCSRNLKVAVNEGIPRSIHGGYQCVTTGCLYNVRLTF